MKIQISLVSLIITLSLLSCKGHNPRYEEVSIQIPKFDFKQTTSFKQKLSEYNIYSGVKSELLPSNDFQLLELSSTLFTDYAHKQRLVKLPEGQQITKNGDGSMSFPDGTILVKTFYYYHDERDTSLGKRIIESRLLIKEKDIWNLATYVWNEEQTDALLEWNGLDMDLSWTSSKGEKLSTNYHVPTGNECMTCHQSNSNITPIGTRLRNLNTIVSTSGEQVNQIEHLQSIGLLQSFSIHEIPDIVDYKDESAPMANRARAYLDINCAHCHNPSGWDKANQRRFDFRYELTLDETGIPNKTEKLSRTIETGKMPLIGTTMLHREGVSLINQYLNSL